MRNFAKRLTILFSAGCVGGMANSLALSGLTGLIGCSCRQVNGVLYPTGYCARPGRGYSSEIPKPMMKRIAAIIFMVICESLCTGCPFVSSGVGLILAAH